MRANVQEAEDGFDFAEQVSVRELHAFGVGGRARGVEQGGDVVGGRFDCAEVVRAPRRACVEIADPVRLVGILLAGGCLQCARVGEN